MSDYKQSVVANFGLKVIEFQLGDLKLKEGEELPEEYAGKSIYIRKMAGKEFENFAVENQGIRNDDGSLNGEKFRGTRARFVTVCQTDPEGNALWDDADECNASLANEALGIIFAACQQVNGVGAKAAEVAEKNS